MSAKVMGLVFESDLPRAEKFILLALADHAKEDGSDVYPSVARIGWKTGYSERQIRTIIDSLEKMGILKVVHPGGSGPADVRKYRIVLGAIPMLMDFTAWKESKGAKIAPIQKATRVQFSPDKGAVSIEKGCNFEQNKGAAIAPEPRTITKEQPPLEIAARSAPGTGKIKNSQISRMGCDSRHHRIHQIIMGWYQDWAGTECPWNGAEGAQLKSLLLSTPHWSDQLIITCLENLAKSPDCISIGSPPREWLSKIPKFLKSPLDRFWKPINSNGANGNGTHESKATQRNRRIEETGERVLREFIEAHHGTTKSVPNGTGPGGIAYLAERVERNPSAGDSSSNGIVNNSPPKIRT